MKNGKYSNFLAANSPSIIIQDGLYQLKDLISSITNNKNPKAEEFIPLTNNELESLVLANLPNYKLNKNFRKIKINKKILKDLDNLAIDLD